MRTLALSVVVCLFLGLGSTAQDKKSHAVMDVSQHREVTVNGTRVVLLRVAQETQLPADRHAKPVLCFRVCFLTEFVAEDALKKSNTGLVEVRRPGSDRRIWPADGSPTKSKIDYYDGNFQWSMLEPPSVASPEKARVHEFWGAGSVTDEKIDLVLKDVGFNDRKIDVIFRNVPVK